MRFRNWRRCQAMIGEMLRRLLHSTTFILAALLICGDAAWRLSERKVSNQVDEAVAVHAIQKSVSNQGLNPDVLVVGSSLSYCFTYDVDSTVDAVDPEKGDPAGGHSNCADDKFMEQLLAERGKPGKHVFVMALPGAMATDLCNIVESAFAEGKRPKVVIYTAAPRDFVDRLAVKSYSDGDGTAGGGGGYSFSAKKKADPSQMDRFKNMVALVVPPSTVRRFNAFAAKPSSGGFLDLLVCSTSQLYEQRTRLKEILVDFVCNAFSRDRDVWSAANNVRVTQKNMSHFDRDLGNYMARYRPPNFERLHREAPALRKLADVCTKNGATLILINMPLSAQNKALLDAKLYAEYKADMSGVVEPKRVIVLDSDAWRSEFPRATFLDSAHLNRAGSKRLQQLVAPVIAEQLN